MRLSKSRLVAHKQCRKRLWLQVHRPELAQQGEALANRMAQGNLVGAAAQLLFPEGLHIEHFADLASALDATNAALKEPGDVTLFEPVLRCADMLVRADIVIRRGGKYRMIEVKASTKVRAHQVTDAGIQAWVARGAGLDVDRIELAHINNQFVYAGSGNYRDLFSHADVTDAVVPLQEQIPVWIAAAQHDLAGPMPDTAIGAHCTEPFACEFTGFCAPAAAEYPVGLLPHGRKLAQQLRDEGFHDLRDVPVDRLSREDHQRIWRATSKGEAELLSGAADLLAALPWPRYFLDFETVGPAVPLWAGTRPYQKIPMQWSCHRQDIDGALTQLPPFLATTGDDPRRSFAASLLAAIGDAGPIMVYNISFERGVLLQMADAFPDLASALRALADRLVDLHPLVRAHYYHPAMMGSWTLKRVLPTLAPDLDYANLDDVQSGDMVEPVYFEMIDPATPAERRDSLQDALLTYCARDTLALVKVAEFLAGVESAVSVRRY